MDNWHADENTEKHVYVTREYITSVLMAHSLEGAKNGMAGQGKEVGARPECRGFLANDSKIIAGELVTARGTEDGNRRSHVSANVWKRRESSRTGLRAGLEYEKEMDR